MSELHISCACSTDHIAAAVMVDRNDQYAGVSIIHKMELMLAVVVMILGELCNFAGEFRSFAVFTPVHCLHDTYSDTGLVSARYQSPRTDATRVMTLNICARLVVCFVPHRASASTAFAERVLRGFAPLHV